VAAGAVGGTSEEVSEESGRDSQINSDHSPARGSVDVEQDTINTQQTEPETPSLNPKAKAFGEKWKPRLSACLDMLALESTLDELADDWQAMTATKPANFPAKTNKPSASTK
jgi:hypothetical protein